MPSNVTSYFDNLTGIQGYFTSVNVASGGIFTILVLIAVFVISFIAVRKFYGTSTGIILSSTLCSVLSTLLWGGGYVKFSVIPVFVVLLVVGIFGKWISKE